MAMTTANKVTIGRILLVPLFVVQVLEYAHKGVELHRVLAIACFAIAAISDGIDGYIARRFNQRSELGAFLDPLADKLLLLAAIIILSLNNEPHLQQLPLWLTATLISRDVVLWIGVVVIYFACGRVKFEPRWTSKVATVLQMAVVLWTLLKWDEIWHLWISVATAVLTGIAGFQYVMDGITQLSASPSSAPTSVTDKDQGR